nr:type II secretion system protein N [Shewanella sp. WXL01]
MLIYVFFLVAYVPANWLVSIAPVPHNIKLSGVSGTLWQGQADMLKIDRRQIDQVSWQLNPWSLLLAQADLDVTIGTRATPVSGKANVTLSMSGIKAENLRFEAPSSFLLAGARLPFRTKVLGDLSVIVEKFEQGQPWCEQLTGKLFVNGVDVTNQFGAYPLGNMAFNLACVDGQVQLSAEDKGNDIGLAGTVTLVDQKRVQVAAKIKPTPNQPEDLTKALAFLGKQDSQGYYPINYQGRIPGM